MSVWNDTCSVNSYNIKTGEIKTILNVALNASKFNLLDDRCVVGLEIGTNHEAACLYDPETGEIIPISPLPSPSLFPAFLPLTATIGETLIFVILSRLLGLAILHFLSVWICQRCRDLNLSLMISCCFLYFSRFLNNSLPVYLGTATVFHNINFLSCIIF